MRKTVSGALSVLKMFKTALHGEKVVHIYWHTSAFSLRLRLSHAMHAITSILCRGHIQGQVTKGYLVYAKYVSRMAHALWVVFDDELGSNGYFTIWPQLIEK